MSFIISSTAGDSALIQEKMKEANNIKREILEGGNVNPFENTIKALPGNSVIGNDFFNQPHSPQSKEKLEKELEQLEQEMDNAAKETGSMPLGKVQ